MMAFQSNLQEQKAIVKLGTKTRYSSRAMLELALHFDSEPRTVSAREMAAHQELSPKYLESLLAALRAASLVTSVRGTEARVLTWIESCLSTRR